MNIPETFWMRMGSVGNAIRNRLDPAEGSDRTPILLNRATCLRFLFVFLMLATAPGWSAGQVTPPDRADDTIARVNGMIITRREFQVAYRQAVDRHAREGNPVDEAHLAPIRRSVIDDLVEEELLFQESRRMGIAVATDERDDAVAAARKHFADAAGTGQDPGGPAIDESRLRRMAHRQIAIERLLASTVIPSITIAEEEIRQFYDANQNRYHTPAKIRLRHILVRRPADNGAGGQDTPRRTMEEIKAKLDRGGDFAALAKEYSQEPPAAQGGDLGYLQRGQLLPALETAVFDLEVGEVSAIMTSEHGLHLFQVTDRRPATSTPLEAARPDIRKTLFELKRDRAVRAYIGALRKKADIQSAH